MYDYNLIYTDNLENFSVGIELGKLTKSGRPWCQVFYIGDPDVICLA
jgi:hypothetical protein